MLVTGGAVQVAESGSPASATAFSQAAKAAGPQAPQALQDSGFTAAAVRHQEAASAASAAAASADAAMARAAAARRRARERAAAAAAAAARKRSMSLAPPPALSPGSAQAAAYSMLSSYGWSPGGQFGCLVELWNRESGWNPYATNPRSGAYGIPQALPAWKMASAGADWRTDAVTQIRWGLGYIKASYGSPCGAQWHEQQYGWY